MHKFCKTFYASKKVLNKLYVVNAVSVSTRKTKTLQVLPVKNQIAYKMKYYPTEKNPKFKKKK